MPRQPLRSTKSGGSSVYSSRPSALLFEEAAVLAAVFAAVAALAALAGAKLAAYWAKEAGA